MSFTNVSSLAKNPIDVYQQNQNADTPTPQMGNPVVSELAAKRLIPSTKFELYKSGLDGRRGVDGIPGDDGTSKKMEGKDGQRGTDGHRGKDAQDIHISLVADAQFIWIKNHNDEHHGKLLLGSPETAIILKVEGGKGGDGGVGGDGGIGEDGSRGKDADTGKSGTDGEAGGAGGSGGKGGLGAYGGKDGHVVVEIDERDTDLLMLVTTPTLKGGKNGNGGKGGQGGVGGRGGAGGSSYEWSTTSSYTDSDGNSQSTIDYHSNPGGRSGQDGLKGPEGEQGEDGLPGEKGTYIINVSGVEYPDKYDLSYSSSKIESDDGIIEPNETLQIKDLTFENSGKMPTPKDHPILVYLEPNKWLNFNKKNSLKISRRLDPDEPIVLRDPLKFSVKPAANAILAIDSTFSEKLQVDFRANIARVNKEFETVTRQNAWYNIRYPVEMSIVSGMFTISRDEEAPVTIRLRNVSNKAIGHKAQDPRPLSVGLQVTDGISGKSLQFYDRSRNSTSDLSKPLLKKISDLKRTDVKYVSGALKFMDPKTPAYTKITLTFGLHLGNLQGDGEDIIQLRTCNVQLADSYRYDSEADFVLVTNSATSRKTVKLWTKVAKRLGTKISLWNTSLYSGLSYTQKWQDQGSWISQLKGKVIIILNNKFSIGIDKKTRSTDYLDPMEIFEAAQRSGVATYVIGGGFKIKKAIMPLSDREVWQYGSIKKILASKKKEAAELQYPEMIVKKRFILRRPNVNDLVSKAVTSNKKLQKKFPDQQNLPVYTYEPTKVPKKSFTWELGSIQFRPTLDRTHAHIAYRQGETENVEDADVYAVIKLLPLSRKLDLIEDSVKNDGSHARILKEAILSDLADEILTSGENKWSLKKHLRQLKTLTNYEYPKQIQSKQADFIIDLLSKYRSLTERLHLERFNRRRKKKIAKIVMKEVDRLLKRLNVLGTYTYVGQLESPEQASNPYRNVEFDNKMPLTPISNVELPDYKPQPSSFIEGQGFFASAKERERAIKSYEEKCEFDYKDA